MNQKTHVLEGRTVVEFLRLYSKSHIKFVQEYVTPQIAKQKHFSRREFLNSRETIIMSQYFCMTLSKHRQESFTENLKISFHFKPACKMQNIDEIPYQQIRLYPLCQ